MAFFPCIYFSQQNTTFFDGTNINWKNNTTREKAELILQRNAKRQEFYECILKMCVLCDTKGIRLIVENPYSTHHFLHNNFMYKPTIIDRNRRDRGDYFAKPTQYFFVGCVPTQGFTFQQPKSIMNVNSLTGHTGSLCDEERSMISPDYARNFICDFILGKRQPNIDPQLFD